MSEELPLRAATLPELIVAAVRIERAADDEGDHSGVWPLIDAMKDFGEDAREAGLRLLDSADPAERSIGADLLGQLCNPDVRKWGASIAEALVRRAERESDDGVLWSIVHAFKFTWDPVAGPTLARLAQHPDSDVRFAVACALPNCDDDGANASVLIPALLLLMEDENEQVRDWATFGLGRQLELDGREVRDALARRLDDPDEDTRDEGIFGLARRRDHRALARLADCLLEKSVRNLSLEAACYLADPTLLPALEAIGSHWSDGDDGDPDLLNRAIWWCDPEHQHQWRELQEGFLGALTAALGALGGAWTPALSCPLLDLGVAVAVEGPDDLELDDDLWTLVMERSGGSITTAVGAVVAELAAMQARRAEAASPAIPDPHSQDLS